MSAPLIFVRDARTLPYIPVTQAALDAIKAACVDTEDHKDSKRLVFARSLYMALLELANERRADRAAVSRKTLAERSGMSREMVTELRRVLQNAGVVTVEERMFDGQRLENEWIVVEPEASVDRTPLPARPDPAAPEAQLTEEGKKNVGDKSPTAKPDQITVRRLFAFWQEQCGHPDAKPLPKRIKAIERMLKQDYTAKQIATAIVGAKKHAVVSDNGVRHDDIELICRDGVKLESFIARADLAGPATKPNGRPLTTLEKRQAPMIAS